MAASGSPCASRFRANHGHHPRPIAPILQPASRKIAHNTIVVIGCIAKGDTKSVVSVVHTASDAIKKEWTTQLDALTTFLTTRSRARAS